MLFLLRICSDLTGECKVLGRWMQCSTVKFWKMEWWKALRSWRWRKRKGSFSKIMIPNIPQKRQPSGLKTMIFKHGLPNPQTLTQLNTYGCTWRRGWGNIQHHQRGFMNCGREWQKSGTKLLQKHAKDLHIESMPRWVQTAIKAKGGHTKY